ncbi:MAG: hypothetical protein A3D92_09695 [Bacteroidetes bacterium RIFCSPHIGHO2_02_FULL_44_7]|nr:MAG: hypothetical protein A3D92_09695 [Bacteroidetes bacterium RIFCSPHIGHO2_02_FULL_44_7]
MIKKNEKIWSRLKPFGAIYQWSETTGVVDVKHPNASASCVSLSIRSLLIPNFGKRLEGDRACIL